MALSEISAVPSSACAAKVLTAFSTACRDWSVLGLNSFCRSAPKSLNFRSDGVVGNQRRALQRLRRQGLDRIFDRLPRLVGLGLELLLQKRPKIAEFQIG